MSVRACRQRSAWWIPVLRFLCAQRDFLTDDEIDVAGEVASSPRHLLWLPAGRCWDSSVVTWLSTAPQLSSSTEYTAG
jgi:hypothetical protein